MLKTIIIQITKKMEQILGIDSCYPMKKYCDESVIKEYHEYIMEYVQKTLKRKKKHKLTEDDYFEPAFDVESILDEKQDSDDENIQVKIRWKGFPKEYDSWTYSEFLDENSLKLVHDFRRKQMKLGKNGFTKHYWETLYAEEWKSYMDGTENAIAHAEYAYAFFKKYDHHNDIESVADFGFGKGCMMDAFVKKFRPKIAYGLEPSLYAFEDYQIRFDKESRSNSNHFNRCHFHAECLDLRQYFRKEAMTKDQVKTYNERIKERKRRRSEENNEPNRKKRKLNERESEAKMEESLEIECSDEDMQRILNEEGYKEFCFCSRGNSKGYYQRKMSKINRKNKKNKKKKKQSRDELIADLDCIYDRFNCACLGKFKMPYDLGVCVSVCQYMSDEDVELTLRELSKQCDWLYFDVVTKEEYDVMRNGSLFKDEWAVERTKDWYLKRILKHWRILTNKILESKYFFPTPADSNFPNTLYISETYRGNESD